MGDVPFTKRRWSGWITTLEDPEVSARVNLVGFPGRMRLPTDWRTAGSLPDEHLLYLAIESGFDAELAGERIAVGAGDLLWIGPGVKFRCVRSGRAPLVLLRARLRLMRKGVPVPAPDAWRVIKGAQVATGGFEALIGEAGGRDPWSAPRTRGLLLAVFGELARLDRAKDTPAGRLTPAQRTALVRHIATNPSSRPAPRELAGIAGLSPDYFARCFRRTFGQSPRRWLLEQRIRLAAHHLVESERRVGEIAREFGYADVFLFSRQFKAVMGRGPLRYRRMHPTADAS